MPTQSDVPFITKDSCTLHFKKNVMLEKLNREPTATTDLETLKNGDSQKKKVPPQPAPQQQAFNGGSPRRKFMNRTMNPQNGNRQNRNHSLNKKTPSDTNNNNASTANKLFNSYKGPNMTQQQKMMPIDYQNPKLNGHSELQKKSLPSHPHKFRTITKSTSHYLYEDYSPGANPTAPSFPAEFHGENSKNSHNIQSNQSSNGGSNEITRKYSKDFLHTGLSPVQQSPKIMKNNDDMSLKMAFGDNSKNYGHFVSYGNQLYGSNHLMVQPSYQQQSYARAAYQQLQHQEVQRLQRMFPPPETFQRVYQQSMYGEPHPDPSKCNCSQGNHLHQSHGFSQQQNYTQSPSYQNRSKGDRRDYRDNTKKNRNGYGGYQNGLSGDRNYNPSHKKEFQNRGTHLNKSHSFNEEDKRKNQGFQRVNSEDQCFRSLSPTPPNSSKSSSPGASEKCAEKESGASTDSAPELVDDSLSTASSGQSYTGDMVVSRSEPALLHPEEPVANVSLWMDHHYGSSAFHNGLSLSAEHLSFREPPYTIIQRQPEHAEPKKSVSMPLMRNVFNPPYDPQYPFDYYLSRSKESVVLEPPSELKCASPWDRLSEQMWSKFREYQQSHQTYTRKMLMWRDLHNAMKVSHLTGQ